MDIFTPLQSNIKITLLVIPDSSMMSLASVLDVMRAANRLSQQPLFSWQITTLDGEPAQLTCGLPVYPDKVLSQSCKGDVLIIICGFNQDKHISLKQLRQLKTVLPNFKALGGIEAGGWILARIGRLNGKQATTHWEDLEDFAQRFPQVITKPDRYVIDGNIFTTGGASPSFDFMLHWIRQRFGYQLALDVASVFIYDGTHQGTDAQHYVSLGMLENHEPRVAAAIRLMEQHIETPIKLPEIAIQLGVSVRTLEHLFTQELKVPPGRYYMHLRLQTARRLVLDTRLAMQEIALRTGFGSLAAFSRQFKARYELSPGKLRSQKQNNT
ncbi:MAG: GlxA family transcriptional regulator [Thiolinea sp.]